MKDPVSVVANDVVFEVDRATHERWPDDFPLAETKTGKPTAAAKRAKPAEVTTLAPVTTKTAAELSAGPTDSGEPAGDANQKGAD
jgi:hypothetical protein